MGDQITKTRETGFAQNIMKSIKGVVVGLCLFLASFFLLWWNEGRIDLSKIVQTSTPIKSETVETSANGKFISVTGGLQSKEAVGDPWYLKSGPYISLNRKVEMYSWVEHTSKRTERKLSGRKVTETTYSYEKEWTNKPPDSSRFFELEGHQNPPLSVEGRTFRTKNAAIGAYRFDPKSANLPNPSAIQITSDNFVPSINTRLEGDYIYVGEGTPRNPRLGDVRISYSAVRVGTTATLFGRLNGDSIGPYFYTGQKQFYRAIAGSREEAIAQIATEQHMTTWILRLAGFLMMWIGLCLFFGPVNAVLDFIPLLGGLGRSVVGISMLPIALGLSLITILISLIVHNIILLMAFVAILFIAPWVFRRVRAGNKATKSGPKKSDTFLLRDSHLGKEKSEHEEAPQQAVQDTDATENAINFVCKECGTRYTVHKSLAGRKARCKYCEHKFYVPYESISHEEIQQEIPDSFRSDDAENNLH